MDFLSGSNAASFLLYLKLYLYGIVACGDRFILRRLTSIFHSQQRMDLDDYHNNFYAGIHAANMAGTWQAIANGFARMRCQNGRLKLNPVLPKWEEYRFRLKYKGSLLEVNVTKKEAKVTLLEGTEASLLFRGTEIRLKGKG